MDSFFLAEMFKYLYLIFAENDDLTIDPEKYVFTTEAHLLPLSLSTFSNHTERYGFINVILSPLFLSPTFFAGCQTFYKSKRIKPQNSKIILDGNDSRSCLNPLPNGQTGKLYQTDDLEGWRQFARSYMLQTSPKWDPKDKNNQKKGTGTAQVNFQTPKLKAKEKCVICLGYPL